MRRLLIAVALACVALSVPRAQITSPPSNYLSSYKAAVLHDRPVAYWRLNETSGTSIADISGGGWTGTKAGGTTLNQTGALADGDKAILFDGATGSKIDTATFTYPFGTGPITLEYWFKTTSVLAQIGVVDDKDSGTNNAGFDSAIFAGLVFFRVANGTSQQALNSTPTTFNDGNWHQYVGMLTRGSPDQIVISIDGGASVFSQNMVTSGMNLTQSAHVLRIGAYTNGGSPNNFVGTLDDVALYNYTLSAAQIATHYAARLYPTVQ